MPDSGLARRMFEAVNHLERTLGRKVTLAEIGQLVAGAQHGRDDDYAPSVVARWIKGTQEPRSREQWAALATALRVDPGWLAFGVGTAGGKPLLDLDPARDHLLTAEEAARAEAQVAEKARASRPARVRKTGNGKGKGRS